MSASTSAAGVVSLRALERVLPIALQQAERLTGDAVVVLRKIDLKLFGRLDGGASDRDLLAALEGHLSARIREAMQDGFGVTPDHACFTDRAHALGAYLDALASSQGHEWPYSTFDTYGKQPLEVLLTCAKESRAFAADVLMRWVNEAGTERALAALTDKDVEVLVALWVHADGVDELPPELVEPLGAVHLPPGATPARLRLRKLLTCFEHWPPIRGESVTPKALEGTRSASPTVELESRAGGLLLWSALLEATGVLTQLADVCPHPRTLSSVLWALARNLESPALDPRDPLLLRFCGELPSARVSASQVLQGAEPEPVHRLALQLAKLEEPELQLMPWGDGWLAITDALVVDSALEGDAEEALPGVVQRFRERTGDAPQSVELLGNASELARGAMELLDAPSIPDRWRPTMLALASVMRQQLRASHGVDLEVLRGWKARLVDRDGNATLVIRRRDVRRVGSGSWVAESVSRFGLGEGFGVALSESL